MKKNHLEADDLSDPEVNKILESMAFFTGKIKQHMEKETSQLHEALLSLWCPQLLQPFPAATIAQCVPRAGQLTSTRHIEQGEKFLSPPLGKEKTPCYFETTHAFQLNPIQISEATWEVVGNGSKIRIGVSCEPQARIHQLNLEDFSVYIHMRGEEATEFLRVCVQEASLFRVGVLSGSETPTLEWKGEVHVAQGGCGREHLLLGAVTDKEYGSALWREYFAFPQKYFFAMFKGLEKIKWPRQCSYFVLEALLPKNITEVFPIDETQLLVNCVPVVNLHTQHSEPLVLSREKVEYPLIIDAARLESTCLYRVDEVVSWDPKTSIKTKYFPLMPRSIRKAGDPYYSVYHHEGMTKLSFENLSASVGETVSCTVRVCHRDVPHHYLQRDHLSPLKEDLLRLFFVQSLYPPTLMRPPRASSHYLEQLASYLSLQFETLIDLHHFKQYLYFHDPIQSDENKCKIESVSCLEMKNINRIHKGVYEQGIEITLLLNEDQCHLRGDLYLFSAITHYFFTSLLPVNVFLQTHVYFHPSGKNFLWKPLFGIQHLV